MTEKAYNDGFRDYLITKFGEVSLQPIIDTVELLVQMDEVLNALKVLDMVPAYFRDHPHPAIQKLRDEINKRRTTPHWYQETSGDTVNPVECSPVALNNTVRGKIIKNDVVGFQSENKVPHLVDFGSGEHWLAHGLNIEGFKFTYRSISLNKKADELATKILGHLMRDNPEEGQPVIFVAGEIIEHLVDMTDIRQDFLRYCPNADIVHFSTPCYCFDAKTPWRERDGLGHIRAMTPREFQHEIITMFPEYDFGFVLHEIMHLRGVRKEKVQ
jgi:hypothetical protein